jgi:hypothetical protein
MKKRISFFLIFVSLFTIFYCKQKVTVESEKPSRVVFLHNTSDTSQFESGMDAIPEGDFIQLEWIPSSEDIVTGYEIYRKETREGAFQKIAGADEVEAYRDVYIDEVDTIGIRYFYYMLAVTPDGEKSDPSDTLDYALIKKAKLIEPIGDCGEQMPVFRWKDENDVTQQGYIIRLVEQSNEDYVWLYMLTSDEINWGGQEQSIRFNVDSSAAIDSLEWNQTYQWRIDIVGPEMNCGSESVWREFTVKTP